MGFESASQHEQDMLQKRLARLVEDCDFTRLQQEMRPGVDLNFPISDGKFSLLHLLMGKHEHPMAIRILDLLVKNGADVNNVSGAGITPLHEAIARRSYRMVERLIEHGADVNAGRTTPLGEEMRWATFASGQMLNFESAIGTLLLKNGADPALVDHNGNTAVDCCLRRDSFLRKLIDAQFRNKTQSLAPGDDSKRLPGRQPGNGTSMSR